MTDVVCSVESLTQLATSVMAALGCDDDIAAEIAEHLVAADLHGVSSHGTMRLTQYAKQAASGYMTPVARPSLERNERGAWIVDGTRGYGMPAMNLATTQAIDDAASAGIGVVGVVNSGHTGRIGAYVEAGAEAGCLTICFGGGGRERWRQVAPFGGIDPIIPTNPYAFGIPGGASGPVVIDFATGATSGGRAMAAKVKGELFTDEAFLDAAGQPSRDPNAYLDGGAIRPAAGPKGYGLGLMAELVADAMLGPVTGEGCWLIIAIDVGRYREGDAFSGAADQLLAELRESTPAAGFERVEIPGERERLRREQRLRDGIPIAEAVWTGLVDLEASLSG